MTISWFKFTILTDELELDCYIKYDNSLNLVVGYYEGSDLITNLLLPVGTVVPTAYNMGQQIACTNTFDINNVRFPSYPQVIGVNSNFFGQQKYSSLIYDNIHSNYYMNSITTLQFGYQYFTVFAYNTLVKISDPTNQSTLTINKTPIIYKPNKLNLISFINKTKTITSLNFDIINKTFVNRFNTESKYGNNNILFMATINSKKKIKNIMYYD